MMSPAAKHIEMIAHIYNGSFGQFCPAEKKVEETYTTPKGKQRKRKVPVFIKDFPQFQKIIKVRYMQETIVTKDYVAPANVAVLPKNRKYHEGRLVFSGISKKNDPYLTIWDLTRVDVVTGKHVFRSVRLETLSFLEVDGIVIVENGVARPNRVKISRALVMRRAWFIFRLAKENNEPVTFSKALKESWKLARFN